MVLLLTTLACTTTIGALWNETTFVSADSLLLASPSEILRVWSDRKLLGMGLAYSLPLLFILLCHELGHYFACRYYRLPATLPYFLPAPIGLGTLGAFIRIRAPIRSKVALFDVGIAGPIAGFIALVPVLFYGVAHSTLVPPPANPEKTVEILGVGSSLVMQGVIQVFHGAIPTGATLDLHPAALAAWVGLLATALNLLPLGQLDGGHILYAALGPWQRRLATPLWILLAVTGLLWPGWWIWCAFVLAMGLRHPPVRDELRPLDRQRRWLAAAALLIFLLCFIPIPMGIATAPMP